MVPPHERRSFRGDTGSVASTVGWCPLHHFLIHSSCRFQQVVHLTRIGEAYGVQTAVSKRRSNAVSERSPAWRAFAVTFCEPLIFCVPKVEL
jgi:hypothetical protein